MGNSEEVQRSLGRIEGKQDQVLDSIRSLGTRVGEIEKRTSALERFRYTLAGAALVGGALAKYVFHI